MTTEVSKLNRFLGYLIDGIIVYIPMYLFSYLTIMTGMFFLYYIGVLVGLGYILLRDALFEGQSIGKKVMKYRAVKEDGSSLAGDFATSATRNITLLIPLLDPIFILIDKPRLGDTLAKTRVINTI
ncbi:MAG TPA: RDD family protein [Flavobacterium sp.]|nr:RDD family protein [Flavobacterium sp.]